MRRGRESFLGEARLPLRTWKADSVDQIECKFFINSYGNRPTTQGIIVISRNDSGGRARGGSPIPNVITFGLDSSPRMLVHVRRDTPT
jgi:hypothetical protein